MSDKRCEPENNDEEGVASQRPPTQGEDRSKKDSHDDQDELGRSGSQRLGKMLFERRGASMTSVIVACALVGPLGLLLAVASVSTLFGGPSLVWQAIAGLVAMAALCGGVVYYYLYVFNVIFRVYEHGVSKEVWGTSIPLLYDEIESVLFIYLCQYTNGAYSGNGYVIHFYPFADRNKSSLHFEFSEMVFTAREVQFDKNLAKLRDECHRLIHLRMQQQIHAGDPVHWMKGLRFLPEGLEHQRDNRPVVIPYFDIRTAEIAPSRWGLRLQELNIFVGSEKKPLITAEFLRQPNNVPGLMLLNQLMSQDGPRPSV